MASLFLRGGLAAGKSGQRSVAMPDRQRPDGVRGHEPEQEDLSKKSKGSARKAKPLGAGHGSFDRIDSASLFKDLRLKKGSAFLDIACGRGAYTLAASGPPRRVRLEPRQVEDLLAPFGFRKVRFRNLGPDLYELIFRSARRPQEP